MEEDYSKRELDHYFKDLFSRMDKQDKHLSDISTKVGIQNGRVTKIEDWITEAKVVIEGSILVKSDYIIDKTRVWTAIAVLSILGGVIITLSIFAIDTKIERGINAALSEYNIEVQN